MGKDLEFDLSTGFDQIEKHIKTRSYVAGYSFTPADTKAFASAPSVPCKGSYPNSYRWYIHIAALQGAPRALAGLRSSAGTSKPTAKDTSSSRKPQKDEDDIDLFGDDEEEAPAPTQSRAEKFAAIKAEKEAKDKANKKRDRSQIVLEVKPIDTEVDLDQLFVKIKQEVTPPGLTWGQAHQKVPVAFGIQKLIVSFVIFDDEVSVDDVTEKIEGFEDEVQSVDIQSFNKL